MTAVAKGMKPIRENLYFVAASLSDYPENKYSRMAAARHASPRRRI
jgi:hypothetical protein